MSETLIWMIFTLVLIILFWVMPDKKINTIRKFITSILQVFPISKIAEAILTYIPNRNKASSRIK